MTCMCCLYYSKSLLLLQSLCYYSTITSFVLKHILVALFLVIFLHLVIIGYCVIIRSDWLLPVYYFITTRLYIFVCFDVKHQS